MRNAKTFLALGATVFVAAGMIARSTSSGNGGRFFGAQIHAPVKADARFVGSAVCSSCHATESADWKGSQHRAAMSEANERSVLGNFRNATFTYAGTRSVFFTRGSKFFVRTDDRDGQLRDFEIRYTFGVYPLQQYLVAFDDGRIQPLAIAWDARQKKDGGQRWFHLNPGDHITHDDELHWTRPSQNWNFMCADCHSTAVRKNYDAAGDRFNTQWAEISVGCEACHGPASRHIDWAKQPKNQQKSRVADDPAKGFVLSLDERRNVAWDNSSGQPVRSKPRTTEREIQVCAQCHARRAQIADGYEPGKPLLDYYLPALLTRSLYYADGQQRGEVYDWGSFLQSRMHAKGVTCSDCHNPHSGKLRATQTQNAVCTSCHLAPKYDVPAHHHHEPASAGASCAGCHMPTKTYMVVDPRHDHSLRVPRPDRSVALGTPNACTGCHTKRDASWASARIAAWLGSGARPSGYQQFASVFAAADAGVFDAQAQLRELAGDAMQSAIARATAFTNIKASDTPLDIAALDAGLRDASPLIRLGALQAAAALPAQTRASLVAPLLSDSLRSIRIAAANLLADVPAMQLSPDRRIAFDVAAAEFVAAQRYNADRAEAHVNLGSFYAERGDIALADAELRAAIRIDPFYSAAYVNLADIYRVEGREVDGERALRDGISILPANGTLHYARGLALVRLKRVEDAVGELHRATALDPTNSRFVHTYAIALQSTGKVTEAIQVLERARDAHPNDAEIGSTLAGMRLQGQKHSSGNGLR